MTMEAFVLGTGGSMPLPGRHLTSVLLRREGEVFLFDCGEGTQVSLRALNLKWKKITAILISHSHADHITGLPGMLMLSSQVERDEPLTIIGPPKTADYVAANRRTLDMYINFEIRVQEIDRPDEVQRVHVGDGFEIFSFPAKHSRVCVGYALVEEPRPGVFHPERAGDLGVPRGPLWAELQAGRTVSLPDGRRVTPSDVLGPPRRGRKFTYITDTVAMDSLLPWYADADLVISEGMFTEEHRESANSKKHMTARDAGRLARLAGGVRRLGLIHFSPRFTNRQLADLEREAQIEFKDAFITRDRMHVPIPYRD